MSLLTYTSYEMIRGLLGVSEKEVEDSDLALDNYALAVEMFFEEENETITTLYATIAAISAGTRTTRQQQFYRLVQTVAAYVVAKDIAGGSIAMFSPIQITDGGAEQQRVADPFEQLRTDLAAGLALWLERLGTCLSVLDSTQAITSTSTRVFAVAAGLATDPITGV